MVKSKWRNLEIIDGEAVETGEIEEIEFPTFIGYRPDCYDTKTDTTYRYNKELGKYVELSKDDKSKIWEKRRE